MAISLFTYGTLEIPQVMEAVTGRSFPSTVAVLRNYARFLLQAEAYPGIYPDFHSEVVGVLYEGVDRDSIVLLDLFEGDFYRREKVEAVTPARRRVDALTYVVRPEHRPLFSSQPWDRDEFIARHLEDFLPYCIEFHLNQTRRLGLDPGRGGSWGRR
jgi:gamma-glutamylcyclotransferase (GGCT)/AIG2-like uncharacterized protein YtfP